MPGAAVSDAQFQAHADRTARHFLRTRTSFGNLRGQDLAKAVHSQLESLCQPYAELNVHVRFAAEYELTSVEQLVYLACFWSLLASVPSIWLLKAFETLHRELVPPVVQPKHPLPQRLRLHFTLITNVLSMCLLRYRLTGGHRVRAIGRRPCVVFPAPLRNAYERKGPATESQRNELYLYLRLQASTILASKSDGNTARSFVYQLGDCAYIGQGLMIRRQAIAKAGVVGRYREHIKDLET